MASGTEVPLRIGEQEVIRCSCNGLLCLERKGDSNYYVYNPITYKTLDLPTCGPQRCESVAIGFIPSSQVYKAVRVYSERWFDKEGAGYEGAGHVVEVCTLGADTRWRKLDYRVPGTASEVLRKYMVFPSPVQVNGAMHWVHMLGHGLNQLVSLDLESEQMSRKVLRRQLGLKKRNSCLFDWPGLVAWLCFLPPNLNVFVLHGDVWTLKDVISFQDLEWEGFLNSRHILHPVVYKDGELFFSHFIETPAKRTPVALTAYNMQTRQSRTLHETNATYILPHTNSLAACPGMRTLEDQSSKAVQ